MKKWICSALAAAFAPTLVGCTVELAPLGEAGSEYIFTNGLLPSALSSSALVPSALAESALAPSALVPSALAAITDPGPAGDLSRALLEHTVGCALGATQSFSFSWTDAASVVHQESYAGMAGLATSWATQPLVADTQQRLISGCLAGRTNYFGTTVDISMRSSLSPLNSVPADELAAYPHVEGAFWGNLFSPSPHLSACYDAANVANSRAHLRDCATGYLDPSGQVEPCGPIVLAGDCAAVCASLGSGAFYTSCRDTSAPAATAAAAMTTAVVTTALP